MSINKKFDLNSLFYRHYATMADKPEIWASLPADIHPTGFASNLGRIKIDEKIASVHKTVKLTSAEAYYGGVSINSKNYYVHRLVFAAFNPDINVSSGRVIFKNITDDMINEDGLIKSNLDYLFYEAGDKDLDTSKFTEYDVYHSVYKRKVTLWKWIPLYGHRMKEVGSIHKIDGYEIMLTDIPERACVVRSKRGKQLKQSPERITYNIKSKVYCTTHLMMASAFPDIEPNENVDHIDNNSTNSVITNLQWLSRSDNSKKATKAPQKERIGKSVYMVSPDDDTIIAEFETIVKAARYIRSMPTNVSKASEATMQTKIGECTKENSKRKTAYGYKWRLVEIPDLDDEVWKSIKLGAVEVQVSNRGRYINNNGIITKGGANLRTNQKYRCVGYCTESSTNKTNSIYMHILVYRAFKGEIPEGMVVMHDDKAPLEDGLYRNWAEDLTVGTPSENMRSAAQEKRNRLETGVKQVNLPSTSRPPPPPPPTNLQFKVKPIYEYTDVIRDDCVIRTKNGEKAVYDIQFYNDLSKFNWDPSDLRFRNDKKMQEKYPQLQQEPWSNKSRILLKEFVYYILAGNPYKEGYCLVPVEYTPVDIRLSNIQMKPGIAKNYKPCKDDMLQPPPELYDEYWEALAKMQQ